jgi:hypothetical protein
MFLWNLQMVSIYVAMFSPLALLLELQLLFIGFDFMSVSVLVVTAIVGVVALITSLVLELTN